MIEIFMGIFGVVGAGMCVLAYFLLERGIFNSSDIRYYAMNGIGATLVLIGAFYSYDSGDLGAIVQEFFWVAISLAGIFKALKYSQTQQ